MRYFSIDKDIWGSLPAGPDLPASRQTFEWFTRPYEFLSRCEAEFGDTFTLTFQEFGSHVIFSNPLAIRDIFAIDSRTLSAGEGNVILGNIMGSRSMFAQDGERHLRQRRSLGCDMARRSVRGYAGIIRKATRDRIATWRDDHTFPILDELLELSLDVLLELIFGPEDDDGTREIRALVLELMAVVSTGVVLAETEEAMNPFDPRRRLRRIKDEFREAIAVQIARVEDEEVKARRDMLVAISEEVSEDPDPDHHGGLDDRLLTLLVAGHETTATATAWAIHWLVNTPNAMGRLLEELGTFDQDGDAVLLSELPYLSAVCQEALRISPVVPVVSRVVKQPVEVQGIQLPPGTTISVAIYLAHRRADVYERPDAFIPERFLERRYQSHEFLPFGGGVRRCIGMHLALDQMKIMLATVLLAKGLRINSRRPIRPVRRSLTVGPSEGLPVVTSPRSWPG